MQDRFAEQRAELRGVVIDDRRHWRILAIGRLANGSTDIVACLIRALRNLGHAVLHLDPRVHTDLVSNPFGLKGGLGPIWIERDVLEPAIVRFRPQLIVVLAGGMAFRPEDAEALQRRGIVLLGVTLSDPDVFESVVGFADSSFDFHTTNALGTLARYREQGVGNTLHFPFGVDRAFAAQQVAISDGFAADVICLGHATARPERDGVMRSVAARLAGRHTVRGYGRGWTLPDSKTVEGVAVLQASRGGRIHVNFPATRAGHVNVKCGAFETVASGGLLVTARFDEMALFFDYGSEIIGYSDYDDLVEQVDAALSEPGRVEAMSRAAFARLCREHLYEYRWRDLFDRIVALAETPPGWLPSARAAAIRTTLSETNARCRPVMLSGYYGAGNAGDELILRSLTSAIEAGVPGGQVMVAAQNARNVELAHGLGAVSRANHAAADTLLAQCDAMVLGGGGLWHDYTFAEAGGLRSLFTGATISIGGFGILPMLARLRRIPFHVYGMGVGPLTDPDAQTLVRFIAEGAALICVRDPDSKRILDALLPDGPAVEVAPDVVYAVDLPEAPSPLDDTIPSGSLVIGANLRVWNRSKVAIEAVAADVAAAIRAVAATQDGPVTVVALPMQDGMAQDRRAMALLAATLPPEIRLAELPSPLTPNALIGALRRVDIVVAMRLHACLLAHRLLKPVVGLAYDPKLAAHFAELDRSRFCLPLDGGAEALAAALRAALADRPDAVFAARIAAIEQVARDKIAAFARRLTTAPQRNAVWAIPPAEASRPAASQRVRVLDWDTDAESAAAAPAESGRTQSGRPGADYGRFLPGRKVDVTRSAQRIAEAYSEIPVDGRSTAALPGRVTPLFDLTRADNADPLSAPHDAPQSAKTWPREGIALGYGQNDAVEMIRELAVPLDASLVFTLRRDAPAAGEWSALGFSIAPANPTEGLRFSFHLRTPYERPKNAGLIALQVVWNGTVLGEEDIALENESFDSELQAPAAKSHHLLFRLIARKACGAWHWPNAARTTVSGFSFQRVAWTGAPQLRADSRHMVVHGPAAAPS